MSFNIDQDEICQKCPSNEYATMDCVRFLIWPRPFNIAAVTSFPATKCCHLVSEHEAAPSAYNTFILVIAVVLRKITKKRYTVLCIPTYRCCILWKWTHCIAADCNKFLILIISFFCFLCMLLVLWWNCKLGGLLMQETEAKSRAGSPASGTAAASAS